MSYTRDQILLSVNGVTKRYGTKEVLSNVNLEVRDLHCSDAGRTVGQVVGIVGPSGCGKSTIMRLIAGLEDPTSGDIRVGTDQHIVKRGMVGLVSQDCVVWSHRRVLGNMVLAGELSGMETKEATDRAKHYLEIFGLSADLDKYPGELSGGMRQRLALGRQLIGFDGKHGHESRLIGCDEPFSALDPVNTRIACQTIRAISDLDDRNTIVIISHDVRALLSTADMLIMMGRTRDSDGHPASGGTVVRVIELAEVSLPWGHPDLFRDPEFIRLEREVYEAFVVL